MSITTPNRLERPAYLALFDPQVHAAILAGLSRPDVTGAVCYEVQDFCSSQFGHRTSVLVGPGCTYSLQTALAGRLGDVPSRMAYPIAYYVKAEVPLLCGPAPDACP